MERGGAIRQGHHAGIQGLEERQGGNDRHLRQDVPGRDEPLPREKPAIRPGTA